ncbi:mitochondrial uncoupling protein 1, partial [Tanacetum coccineum]
LCTERVLSLPVSLPLSPSLRGSSLPTDALHLARTSLPLSPPLKGALAISVENPTDLVKARLQAEGKLAPGVPRRYSGALNAYSTIEGVRALWTGLGPNVARNAIINAAKLAILKTQIPGFTDNVLTHLLSGLGAGFLAVCVGSPVDVVKSRMMRDPSYKGTIDCFVKTLKNDGQFAFYKGFIPIFGRLGSWNVIMFLTLEQAKKFVKSIESA